MPTTQSQSAVSRLLNHDVNQVFAAALGLVMVLAAIAPANAANARLKSESLRLTNKPTIVVKFYTTPKAGGGVVGWDATGTTVRFHLKIEVVAGVGDNVNQYIITRSLNDRRPLIIKGPLARKWRHNATLKMPSSKLGGATFVAINTCRNRLPDGGGVQVFPMTMSFGKLIKIATRKFGGGKVRDYRRTQTLRVQVRCEGRTAQRTGSAPGASRKQRFAVKGASVRVTKAGRQCPRTVFVRVTLRGNKAGRARYTLIRSNGENQARTMVVKWQGGKNYSASFDHRFRVGRSRIVNVWVRHKGKRITGVRRIRVNCQRPFGPRRPVIE